MVPVQVGRRPLTCEPTWLAVKLSLLAFGLIAFPTPLDGLPYASMIKFGIIMLMLPIFWLWVIRAVPKGVALDNIPPRALPPERG